MPAITGLVALLSGGVPNKSAVSIRFIDWSGDKRAVSIPIENNATDAQVSTLVATFASLTQAVIWSVERTDIFGLVPTNGGATSDANSSVFDNVVVNFKSPTTGIGTDVFIPAPVESLVLEGDVVDVDNTTFQDLITGAIPALSSIGTAVTARFTERREINPKVSI